MLDVIIVETIARVCHEANRAYCQSLGDNSHAPWEEAPEWQKDSSRKGVRSHLQKNPYETNPMYSHTSWYEEKQAAGWKYGPVKNADKKEHPCMVPYEDLPEFQKIKDSLFKNIVDAFRSQIPYDVNF